LKTVLFKPPCVCYCCCVGLSHNNSTMHPLGFDVRLVLNRGGWPVDPIWLDLFGDAGAKFNVMCRNVILLIKVELQQLNLIVRTVVEYFLSRNPNLQSPTFSSLTWWRDGEAEYPSLDLLTQRVFSLVVSTSSVERSFKTRKHSHYHPQSIKS
jgi:hypothetical protein